LAYERRYYTGPLTKRERAVMLLVCGGFSSEEIGRKLGISCETVNFHIKHAIGKLQARNRTHAAVLFDRGEPK
jgi:DNA-binding CsgD family transcriptional regulator